MEGQTGFHQTTVNPCLQKHFLRVGRPNSHCLVPLSGKSLDMAWLATQDQRVTGVEVSSVAVEEFFKEQKLTHDVLPLKNRLQLYSAENIAIVHGDLFDLWPSNIEPVDWIYDRAALIVFPPEIQAPYVRHLERFLPVGKQILLISFEYPRNEMSGPPFSVTQADIHRLFSPAFAVETLERVDILNREPRWKERGVTSLHEGIYLLTKRGS